MYCLSTGIYPGLFRSLASAEAFAMHSTEFPRVYPLPYARSPNVDLGPVTANH